MGSRCWSSRSPQLWPHQRQRRITWAAYHSIGGVTGALSGYAELVYQDLIGQFPEERIRRVMLALVRSRGGASKLPAGSCHGHGSVRTG